MCLFQSPLIYITDMSKQNCLLKNTHTHTFNWIDWLRKNEQKKTITWKNIKFQFFFSPSSISIFILFIYSWQSGNVHISQEDKQNLAREGERKREDEWNERRCRQIHKTYLHMAWELFKWNAYDDFKCAIYFCTSFLLLLKKEKYNYQKILHRSFLLYHIWELSERT